MAKKSIQVQMNKRAKAKILANKIKTIFNSIKNFKEFSYKDIILNTKLIFKTNFFITEFRNICPITGHARAYYNSVGFSRQTLKESLNNGLLLGVQSSSW